MEAEIAAAEAEQKIYEEEANYSRAGKSHCDFIRAFEQLIEQKTSSPSARLYYLCQFTTGECNQLVKSCLSMQEQVRYTEARRLLKERYGQNYRIRAAHVQKLINGPSIKSEDEAALQQFSIQLTSCQNTLGEIGYLNKLDNPDNLKKIVGRLPYALRLKWRDTVDRIIENEGRDVTVQDINKFVTTKARAVTHPVFGKVITDKGKHVTEKPVRRKAEGFSTQVNRETTPERALCSGGHWLSRCEKFRKQSVKERQDLVRLKRLCINCLLNKHFVRLCPRPSYCKVQGCTKKHSTFLHQNTNSASEESSIAPVSASTQDLPVTNKSNGYAKTSCAANASVTALAILPVEVEVVDSGRTVQTYAFLDNGSNTTFCSENLLSQLQEEGTKAQLSLTTL